MRFALFCNLAGTVMLFLSFQATSSELRLVTTPEGNLALCVNKRALVISLPNGIALGSPTCPNWENSRPAAVVNIEHPAFISWGFILTTLGFILQFLSFPSPKTAAQLRKELKELQKADQLKSRLNPDTKLPHSK
jgi:hypothetical protein